MRSGAGGHSAKIRCRQGCRAQGRSRASSSSGHLATRQSATADPPSPPSRNPGGSSGGTGAAIAASFAAAGMGSDTCGSIRIPASVNNLVGLRPTKGLSSIAGIVPLSSTQDVGGPLARSASDLAEMLDRTIGEDPADPATHLPPGQSRPKFTDALQTGALKGAHFGVLEPLFGDANDDPDVIRVVRAAIEEFQKEGATAVPVPMPDLLAALDGSSVINAEFQRGLGELSGKEWETRPYTRWRRSCKAACFTIRWKLRLTRA